MNNRDNRWLHRFAVLTALATLALLGIGGLVTSHGVGLAVPDWPNTNGYNMFFFPFSKWIGGIFYEHSHRLVAAFVGLLTSALAMWLWVSGTRTKGALLRRAGNQQEETEGTEKMSSPVGSRARYCGLGVMGSVLLLMGIRQMPVYYTLAGLAAVAIVVSLYLAVREYRQSVQELPDIAEDDVRSLSLRGSPHPEDSSRRPLQLGEIVLQDDRWLRWLGIAAFAAVILQGVLGGLRVVWLKDQIGILHALLAQLFFVLVCAIALFTSRWWRKANPKSETGHLGARVRDFGLRTSDFGLHSPFGFRISDLPSRLFLITSLLILFQLVLGATMRHQHAGLAIPDFPLAYGKLWPAMDATSVARYNQQRLEVLAVNPITGFQIGLQMVHRLTALAILAAVGFCAWTARHQAGAKSFLSRLASGWLGLIVVQGLLGAATIWSQKAADIATAHVMVGALSLAMGGMLTLISFPRVVMNRAVVPAPFPGGPPENSLTFQRWERAVGESKVPKGRLTREEKCGFV